MEIKRKKKFGLLGMAYDTSASKGYPGARYAPEQIRKALGWIFHRIEDGMLFDVEENRLVDMREIELKDFGDTDRISRYDHEKSLHEIKCCIDKVYEAGYAPILLGGGPFHRLAGDQEPARQHDREDRRHPCGRASRPYQGIAGAGTVFGKQPDAPRQRAGAHRPA